LENAPRLRLAVARDDHARGGTADGDLSGQGLWVLEPHSNAGVLITYRWDVHLNRRWMRLTAPLLRPVFAWNHFAIMRAGANAMAGSIGCRLLRYRDYTFNPGTTAENLRDLHWPESLALQPTQQTRGSGSD
jgi:hypothetical protein